MKIKSGEVYYSFDFILYIAMLFAVYLVCRDEINEDGVQQLLCDTISLHDDRTHQIQHVHLYLVVMAVTMKEERQKSFQCNNRRNN